MGNIYGFIKACSKAVLTGLVVVGVLLLWTLLSMAVLAFILLVLGIVLIILMNLSQ